MRVSSTGWTFLTAVVLAAFLLVGCSKPQPPATPSAKQLPPEILKLLEDTSAEAYDVVLDEAVDLKKGRVILNNSEVAFLSPYRPAADDYLLKRLADGSSGAASILGDLRCQRALPLLRELLLKDRGFYGWESAGAGTADNYLGDNEYPSQMAYIYAIEEISGQPVAKAVVLTEAERKALQAEAAQTRVATARERAAGHFPASDHWAAKWLLGKLTVHSVK